MPSAVQTYSPMHDDCVPGTEARGPGYAKPARTSWNGTSLRGSKICFIAGTLGQGGAERQLFYVVRMLARLGAEVRVLCLTEREFWEKKIIAAGVAVTYVGRSKSRLLRLARMAAALRRFRPDVVQSQHFYTNLYSALSARM